MKVLITGGAGFIGSHLAERLAADGHVISVLDDLSTGSIGNLAALRGRPRFRFTEGSILDRGVVRDLVSQANYVVHLAAAVGVRRILREPLISLKINVEGTESVLGACAEFGRGILLASSSEVYGKNQYGRLCEDADSILGPSSRERWSYAAAKKLDEFLALAYSASRGVPVVVTRFFNIVGPRQSARYGMVLPAFVRAAIADEPIRVFGDGLQTRNFTYIDDCVEALTALMGTRAAQGQIFNIGGDEEISIRDLAEHVRRAAGSTSPIVTVPYTEAYPEGGFEDMRRRVPCVCRLKEMTGWQPKTTLAGMIAKTIEFERSRVTAGADAALEPVPAR